MYNPDINHNWNEFDWEREIRRDELRISRYFQALSHCLDLPGEDEIIYRGLMNQPELIPHNASFLPKANNIYLEQEEDAMENEEISLAELLHKNGGELLRRIDRIAREWNIVFATEVRNTYMEDAIALTCQFGKLLGRVANFVEVDENHDPGLKISLAKRILADINALFAGLAKMLSRQKTLQNSLLKLNGDLQQLRESTIDILSELRQKINQ